MERTRSWLFSPADVPNRCVKASQSAADQVIFDLEDAVSPTNKESARKNAKDLLGQKNSGRRPWIRVNGLDTSWGIKDLEELVSTFDGPPRWMVPKANRTAVDQLEGWIREHNIVCDWLLIIESAKGLWDLTHAAEPWLPGQSVRLCYGSLDYQADVGGDIGDLEEELLMARSQLVMVSRVFGWLSPIDAVFPAFRDDQGLERASERARRIGFSGKMVIHPQQIEVVNRIFSPSDEERRWAETVLAGLGDQGVAQVNGQMIDRPLVLKAQRILSFFEEPDSG